MLLRPLLLGAALATLAAAPAASASPTLQPLKRCYVAATPAQREPVTISGSGFTPLSTIDIFIDNLLQPLTPNTEPPRANYSGDVAGAVLAPFVETGQRVFSLRLSEHDAPLNTVLATATVTRLSVAQSPERASTGDRVRFRGRGFTNLVAPVYAHYVFAGKSRRTVRIGAPTGPCGRFSVKRRQFPFKKSPRVGVWTIQFDQKVAYEPTAEVRVPLTVKVRKAIKPGRARAQAR